MFCSCPWSWSHIWGRKLPLKPQNKETKLFLLPVLSHTFENEYLGAACNTCMPHSGLHRQPSELSRGRRRSIPSSPIRRNLSTKSPKIRIKKVGDSILNAHSLKLEVAALYELLCVIWRHLLSMNLPTTKNDAKWATNLRKFYETEIGRVMWSCQVISLGHAQSSLHQ